MDTHITHIEQHLLKAKKTSEFKIWPIFVVIYALK